MDFPAYLPPLLSPGPGQSAAKNAAAGSSHLRAVPAQRLLKDVANTAAAPARSQPSSAVPAPRLLQIGHVKNLCAQWEARCTPVPGQHPAPPAPATDMQLTYQRPPLPPAAVFALQPAFEGAPTAKASSDAPSLTLLAAMDAHRREHADVFQWNPLLRAGRPYPPRERELHPNGIQARMLGRRMRADEPPVITHTPAVFEQRAAVEQLRQVLGAYLQLALAAGGTAPGERAG